MATPQLQTQQLHDETLTLRPEERERLKKRRQYVKDYDPPKWRSSQPDPVSGQLIERPMVPHASILHSLSFKPKKFPRKNTENP